MRFSPLLLAPLSGLMLLACGPAGASDTGSSGSLGLTVGAPSQTGLSAGGVELPAFLYPEDRWISLKSEVQVRNAAGDFERFQEVLLADGQGNYRLDVVGWSPDLVQPFSAPSNDLILNYASRMRFMVQYRNPHLRAPAGLVASFDWTDHPGLVQVAGIDCRRVTATSLAGLGDVEFLVDAQTDLVLGWTLFEPGGSIAIQSVATAVQEDPSLTGVTWSAPVVGDQPFADGVDEPLLGFIPHDPQYLPPGFYLEESWLRFSAGLFPGMSEMLVRVYSNGIHLIFVGQHDQRLFGNQLQLAGKLTLVQQADLGGVRVAEGMVGMRKFYVASSLGMEEVQTIFGSLID